MKRLPPHVRFMSGEGNQMRVSQHALVSALVLGLVFLYLSWRLFRDPAIGWAKATFHYSLLYLALIFVALAVDAF